MINKIWFLFISIGIVFGIINNKIDLINTQIIKSAKDSLDIFLNIFPTLVLWVGVMNIVSESGLLIKLSNFIILIHSKSFVHVLPLSGDCLLAFGCRFSRGDCFDGHTVSHGCSHSFNHDAVPDV